MRPKTSPSGTPQLDYRAEPRKWRPRGGMGALALQGVTAYFVASMLTLPFLDALWIGELPVLALLQLPKVAFADWLRSVVVMPTIAALGLSRGSFSPDYLMARPYALALAYVLALGPVFLLLWVSGQMTRPSRRWVWITLLAAVTDFALTLWLAGGRGLTVY